MYHKNYYLGREKIQLKLFSKRKISLKKSVYTFINYELRKLIFILIFDWDLYQLFQSNFKCGSANISFGITYAICFLNCSFYCF